MIVQRVTHYVRRGQRREFLALMKSKDSVLTKATKRTYSPFIAPAGNVVVHEAEFEDLAELDKTWAAWWADTDTPAFMAEYNKLVKNNGSEIWTLEE